LHVRGACSQNSSSLRSPRDVCRVTAIEVHVEEFTSS
jgi:hypothetical protein